MKTLFKKHWHVITLLAWALLTHYPFVYTNGAGEGDSFVIINGIINAINKQDFMANPLLVFNFYSFGYYWLIFKLQALLSVPLTSLFSVVNHLGMLCSVLTTIPLYLLIKGFSDRNTAFYSLLIYHLTPTIFEISTYGHPISIAWLVIICAIYSFQQAILSDSQQKQLLGIATILTAIAMCMRADVLLLAPLLIGILYYHSALNKKWLMTMSICLASAVLLFSIFQFMAIGRTWLSFSPAMFFSDINKFHITTGGFSRLQRGIATFALTIGPFATCLLLVSFVYLYRNQKKLFNLLTLWVVPLVILWLPFPTPSRHFLYAIPGIIVMLVLFIKATAKKYTGLAVLVFILINYYSPLILYTHIVSRTPQTGLPTGQKQVSFSVPLLPAIENHHYLQKELDGFWKKADVISNIKGKSVVIVDTFLLLAINKIITSTKDYIWEGRSCAGQGNVMSNFIQTGDSKYTLLLAPSESNNIEITNRLKNNREINSYYMVIFPDTFRKYPGLQVPAEYKKLLIEQG